MAWGRKTVADLSPNELLEFLSLARLQGVRSINVGKLHVEMNPPTMAEVRAAAQPVTVLSEVMLAEQRKQDAEANEAWSNEGLEDLDAS